MELSQSGVNACVGHGLSVIQGDADSDLDAYPSDAFDYVVLSQTLQATRATRARCSRQLVRIGRRAIVSFPNFGHWRIRLGLLFHGRMPITPLLNQRGTTRRTSISARSAILSCCATRSASGSSAA